eukprot:522356_1
MTEDIFHEYDQRENIASRAAFAWIAFISYCLVSLIMLTLSIVHGRNVYSDLYTTDRKSVVTTRRAKPKLTRHYRRIAFLTETAIVLFALSSLVGVIKFIPSTGAGCKPWLELLIAFVQAGKTCMFTVLILRLERIFKESPYGYPGGCLRFFNLLLILYGIGSIIATFIIVECIVGNTSFPYLCQPSNPTIFIRLATTLFIQDISVAVGFLWSFRIPFSKVIDGFKNKDLKIATKIRYSGYKYAVLIATATISTVVLCGIASLTQIGLFTAPDVIISSMCLMFMTTYYRDDNHFRRWCCICINLYYPTNPTEDQLDKALDRDESFRSADTMSQLRAVGQKMKVTFNVSAKDKVEYAQSDPNFKPSEKQMTQLKQEEAKEEQDKKKDDDEKIDDEQIVDHQIGDGGHGGNVDHDN